MNDGTSVNAGVDICMKTHHVQSKRNYGGYKYIKDYRNLEGKQNIQLIT